MYTNPFPPENGFQLSERYSLLHELLLSNENKGSTCTIGVSVFHPTTNMLAAKRIQKILIFVTQKKNGTYKYNKESKQRSIHNFIFKYQN